MEFILTVFFFFIILGLLARLLLPSLLRFLVRSLAKKYGSNNTSNTQRKEGDTTIISHGEEKSEVPKDFGDYIDYEDIEN